MEQVKNTKIRNYGIDLLRIVAMFFVIIFHSLGQGGILKNTVMFSPQYKFTSFLEICVYCAVDIFALISGYVSYKDEEKRVKYSNYFYLWMQVVFYGLIITIIFNIFNPSMISAKNYFEAVFPVSNNMLWYFTAYTGLFAIMPLLNKAIRGCSKKTLKKLFIELIFIFSVFNLIPKVFFLNFGYSFVWISILYVLGAIIKKCDIGKNLNKKQAIITIIALCLISYIYKIYGPEFSIFDLKVGKDLFTSYTSPTILIIAIIYLIIFSKLNIKDKYKKIIEFGASSAFTVYIINNHEIFWDNIMKDCFKQYAQSSLIKIFLVINIFAITFVIGSILVDKIRMFIFEKLHIRELAKYTDSKIDNFVEKIANLL